MALSESSRSALRNSLLLGLFAVATVTLVCLTQLATGPLIERAERQARLAALAQMLPANSYDNLLLDHSIELLDAAALGNKTPQRAYLAQRQGKPSAVILPVTAAHGYSGAIELLVAIDREGRLVAVRVLKHRETPGLGDKIESSKSPWILGFSGLSLNNLAPSGWAVKKDGGQFDQFAGATITPRAVVKAVQGALRYFDAHRQQLLGDPTPIGEP